MKRHLRNICTVTLLLLGCTTALLTLAACADKKKSTGKFTELTEGQEAVMKEAARRAMTDVRALCMTGPVLSAEDYAMLETKVEFDQQGRLTTIGNFTVSYDADPAGQVVGGAKVRRDDMNRITWVGKTVGKSREMGFHFEFNEKYLTKWWFDPGTDEDNITYYEAVKYDDAKRPISAKAVTKSQDERTETDIEYSYQKVDDFGNWQRCEVTNDFTIFSIDSDGTEHMEDSRVTTTTWKRVILYYKK